MTGKKDRLTNAPRRTAVRRPPPDRRELLDSLRVLFGSARKIEFSDENAIDVTGAKFSCAPRLGFCEQICMHQLDAHPDGRRLIVLQMLEGCARERPWKSLSFYGVYLVGILDGIDDGARFNGHCVLEEGNPGLEGAHSLRKRLFILFADQIRPEVRGRVHAAAQVAFRFNLNVEQFYEAGISIVNEAFQRPRQLRQSAQQELPFGAASPSRPRRTSDR